MSKTTPTQRSLKYLKDNGYQVAITEKWNPFAGIRQDLFGFADLIAFKNGEPVKLVQTTTTSNQAARIKKIKETDTAKEWLTVGEIEVHGWRKNKSNRYEVTITKVVPEENG